MAKLQVDVACCHRMRGRGGSYRLAFASTPRRALCGGPWRHALRTPRRTASLLLLSLALCALSRPGSAWCRTTTCKGSSCVTDDNGCAVSGKKLWWRGRCAGFSLQQNGSLLLPPDKVRAAIDAAYATWSDVDCGGGQRASVTTGPLPDTPCAMSEYDPQGRNVNLVVFRDNGWTFKGTYDNIAKTTVHFDGDTGEIYDVDMEINSASNWFTLDRRDVEYDLQSVITHEVGHFLGIAHSDRPWAVMFPEYEPGSLAGRTLSDDDIEAVCAAYPPGRVATCDLTPRGGFDTCAPQAVGGCALRRDGGPAGGSSIALGAALCVVALRRRREVA